jgi:hypothetical protein
VGRWRPIVLAKSTLWGFSKIYFKTSGADTGGGMFIMEHDNLGKGGPFRHLLLRERWKSSSENSVRRASCLLAPTSSKLTALNEYGLLLASDHRPETYVGLSNIWANSLSPLFLGNGVLRKTTSYRNALEEGIETTFRSFATTLSHARQVPTCVVSVSFSCCSMNSESRFFGTYSIFRIVDEPGS